MNAQNYKNKSSTDVMANLAKLSSNQKYVSQTYGPESFYYP